MIRSSWLKGLARRVTGGVSIALLAVGLLGGASAWAGIASTKHNLGSTGTGVNKFDGTAEICVFCHTPHGADTSAAVPLWNRVLADPATYTTYNSLGTSSLDGATAPVGSVSLACLSCHDGAQAMNVMINQPGSGGYNSAGAALAGNWTGANQENSGEIKSTLITHIGKDLQNDHPIGIQYAGGPTGATLPAAGTDYTSTSFRDKDFNTAKSASLNGTTVWWVDSGTTSGSRDKADMQLYTRTVSTYAGGTTTVASTTAQPFVECASCHDPHVQDVSGSNPTFLRISNSGSAVCLACHIK